MLHIFTLTWNKCDKLTKLKESFIPTINDIEYIWHIKDNNSSDNTYDVVKTWGDNVNVIKYKNNNQNFSEGMNYLFDQAKPKDDDLILLLNNDIVFNDTTSIRKMIDSLKDDVGVVGAKLLFTGSNRLQHAGVVFHSNGLPVHFRRYESDDDNASKNRLFQAITGAVMLLRA
jgi:GT2 family glycosyltransferase